MCLNCGTYYCNYCFLGFDSGGDTQQDRAAAHEHVALHKVTDVAEQRDAFLSPECVQEGQTAHQCAQLKKCLLLAMTSRNFGVDGHHDVCLALILSYADLTSLGIDVVGVWRDAEHSLLSSAAGKEDSLVPMSAATHAAAGDSAEAITAERGDADLPPEQENILNAPRNTNHASTVPLPPPPAPATVSASALQGGRQLVNAVHTLNTAAAAQIMQSFREQLDIDFIDPVSGFPLTSLAILEGQKETASGLLRMGADIFNADRNGRSVMYIAIESGDKALLELILQCRPGLNLNRPVTSEQPQYFPIPVAVRYGRALVPIQGFHAMCSKYLRPYRYDHGHLVRLLVKSGASIEAEEQECHHSPLALALILGSQWAATELVLCGADFFGIPAGGRSPLYIAAERGMGAMVDLMASHRRAEASSAQSFDVNRNVSSSGLLKMLHVACAFVQPAMVSRLIDLGADLNMLNMYGNTPLITALLYDNPDAAVSLIAAGADVTIPSHNGTLPM